MCAFRRAWHPNHRACLPHSILIVGLTLLLANPLAAQEARKYDVDLPAGTLHAALLQFARTHEVSLFFAQETVADVTTPSISGTFTLAELFERLLAGNCLQFELIRPNFLTISPGCSRPQITSTEQAKSATTTPRKLADTTHPDFIEEILVRERYVTGSRVRNPAFGQVMPLDVIDQTEIRLSGYQSVGELLRYVPAVAGNSTSTLVSNGGDGSATITLRGLPASNTLVLLNGRRLNTDALSGGAVDLNSLPLAMIDQVEILKDGVSAIYGSDAVAGVVNIITRNDSHGLSLEAYSGISSENDLQTNRFALSVGNSGSVDNKDWQASFGLSYYDQQGVLSSDRNLSATSDDRARGGIDKRSSATSPARVTINNTPLILREGASGTSVSDFRDAGTNDRFEYRDYTSSIVPSRRLSAFGSAILQLDHFWHAYGELLYNTAEATSQSAPVPLFSDFESVPIRVEAGQLFNPFGVQVSDIRRRFTELPGRLLENDSRTARGVIGISRESKNATHDLSMQYGQTDASERYLHNIDRRTLTRSLQADCVDPCVPLNLFGPAGSVNTQMLEFIRAQARIKGTSRLLTISLNSDWEIDQQQMGKIEVSSGFEYRHEQLSIRPDELLSATALIGAGNRSSTRGSRDIFETYAEMFVPLAANRPGIHRLDAHLAARASYYSKFGLQVNPRLLLSWQPTEEFVFRTSIATGFRAPSLLQLHGSAKQSFEQLNDPCSVAANVVTMAGCISQSDPTLTQYLTVTGGDPDLDPERSRTFSVGGLFQKNWGQKNWRQTDKDMGTRFSQSASISVDFYAIDQRDVVDSSAQYVLNRNAANRSFADRVLRNADGNLVRLQATLQNIGRREVNGFDVTGSYSIDVRDHGKLTLSINGTRISRFRDQFTPTSAFEEKAGSFSDEASGGLGALPKWKWNFSAGWQHAHWHAFYNIYQVSSLSETVPLLETKRTIDAWTTHNANVTYRGPWTKWASVTLGINNLRNETPPFAAAAFNDSYDGRTYDLTGRYYYLRLQRDFDANR